MRAVNKQPDGNGARNSLGHSREVRHLNLGRLEHNIIRHAGVNNFLKSAGKQTG